MFIDLPDGCWYGDQNLEYIASIKTENNTE
jgi:hypothetical protein